MKRTTTISRPRRQAKDAGGTAPSTPATIKRPKRANSPGYQKRDRRIPKELLLALTDDDAFDAYCQAFEAAPLCRRENRDEFAAACRLFLDVELRKHAMHRDLAALARLQCLANTLGMLDAFGSAWDAVEKDMWEPREFRVAQTSNFIGWILEMRSLEATGQAFSEEADDLRRNWLVAWMKLTEHEKAPLRQLQLLLLQTPVYREVSRVIEAKAN